MRFAFTEDQQLLRDALSDLLKGECAPAQIRGLWESPTGRSPALWSQLAESGIPGLMVPEDAGGLGMDEIDFALLLEETGHVALAEPVIGTALVAVPLLRETPLAGSWLPKVAAGEAIVAVGHPGNRFVEDAHVADLLLLPDGDAIHAVTPDRCALTHQPANDPARRIYDVAWTPDAETRLADGDAARTLLAAAFDRGAFGCAAQALGVTRALIEQGVAYAGQREQFGKPIGSFQAVKHMLANLQVRLEYARPLVHRAAHSIATNAPTRAVDVSAAKSAAGEAATTAAKVSLQVHGAIGYTWEQDLHLWMRRAWSLEGAWGSGAWHRRRVAGALFDDTAPARSFGMLSDPTDDAATGSGGRV